MKHRVGIVVYIFLAILSLSGLGCSVSSNGATDERDEAVEAVRSHFSQTSRFYRLNPDRASEQWRAETKLFNCDVLQNQCSDVKFRFNVMLGADVKEITCTWSVVRDSGGQLLSVAPTNTEARELFSQIAPISPPSTAPKTEPVQDQQLTKEQIDEIRKSNQKMFDADPLLRRNGQPKQ